ncbi:MAG: hypothetical protein RR415_13735 [Ruthenibacterium sp.]
MRKVICIYSLTVVSLILVACDISRKMSGTSISNEHQVTNSHSSDSEKSDVAKLDLENQTELFIKQAEILTTHIIEKALLPFDESASLTTLSDREIFNFLSTIYSFHEETTTRICNMHCL